MRDLGSAIWDQGFGIRDLGSGIEVVPRTGIEPVTPAFSVAHSFRCTPLHRDTGERAETVRTISALADLTRTPFVVGFYKGVQREISQAQAKEPQKTQAHPLPSGARARHHDGLELLGL
jgi:hypothetical protein